MKHETFDHLIESLQDSISYISDIGTHEILYMSPSAMDFFGMHASGEYLGLKCYQALHGVEHPCTFCFNILSVEQSASWVQYNQRLKTWVLVSDCLHEIDGRKLRVGTMTELNSRQLWKPELANQLSMETILLQCVQTLSQNGSLDAAVASFLEMVSHFYCADRAYIFEFDTENAVLSNTFEWCAEGISTEAANLQNIPLSVVEKWLVRFRADGEFHISSIDSDLDPTSSDYQLLAEQEVDSLMAAPLYSDGEITGFIGVDNPAANLHNINLLRATTDFVSVELDRRRLLEKLEYLSYTDTLTGAYNRRKHLNDLYARYRNLPAKLGIFLININGLKHINASFGQEYGDSIIQKTASILRETQSYNVYRISGDDFYVPCPEIEREAFLQLEKKLRAAFAAIPECSVSIGASWSDLDIDIDTLILQADEHMRAEKQTYYQSAYMEAHQHSGNPAADVLAEIADDHFKVYYQPKVDLHSRTIVGAEALVRRIGEDGALIPPSQFIPQYEARNVLMHVDLHVLHTALRAVRALRDRGFDLCIAVNFSRSTLLTPDFISRILSACQQHGVPASSIMLEVTETLSTIDRDCLRDLLQSIRRAGLRLSLDDFGSKYSNTSILADIAFDEVKLDKTLVNDICQNPRSRIILKNLMEMCRELGDTLVVAEGIESEAQAALLEEFSCSRGQGYYFYRPMTLEEFSELLENS